MFRFEHHIALWALAVIIPLIVIVYLFIQNWKKRKLRDFGNANVIERLIILGEKEVSETDVKLFASK